MRLMLLLAALLFCGSALAFHCPMDMKKIDDALAAGPALSAEQLAEVKQLRADGETCTTRASIRNRSIPWPRPWPFSASIRADTAPSPRDGLFRIARIQTAKMKQGPRHHWRGPFTADVSAERGYTRPL